MSRVVTDWVLELGESKAGLADLIADVDRYNTSVKKAAETAKVGFSASYQAQLQYNQQLVKSVQQQAAVAKSVEASVAVVQQATEAEKKLGTATTETVEKNKAALAANLEQQRALTAAIDATAAANQRVQAGGSSLPVAPATAVIGAVPSGAATAVSQEFQRQIKLASDAKTAAVSYLAAVSEAARKADVAAGAANEEAAETKQIYTENLQALKALERQEINLARVRANASPGEPWLKANAALDANIAKQTQLRPIVAESRLAYESAGKAAVAANEELVRQADLQRTAKQLVKETALAERELEVAAKAAIAAANQQARSLGLLGQAEQKLLTLTQQLKAAQSKPAIEGINKEIDAVNREIAAYKKLGREKQEPATHAGTSFSFKGLATGLLAAGAAYQTLNKLQEVFFDGLRNAAALNGIQSTFKALTGSAEGGAAEFKFLEQTADDLGLKLIETADSYKLLFAAAKSAGLGVDETREIFSAITAEAKVLGISNAKLESSLRAVSQMLSKGKVSAEELRLQLGEALPDATALAAKALGVTTQELDKMLRKGEIISRDFLPKFAAEIKKTYGDATGDAAVQLQANLNRISNAYESFTAGLVGLLAPAIGALAKLLQGFKGQTEVADTATKAYEQQNTAVKNLYGSIPDLVREGDALVKNTNRNAAEQARLRTIIDEVAAAIPGAVTGFDAYGKALGINVDAVTSFLLSNESLARRLKADALRQNKSLLDELLSQQKGVVGQLNDVTKINNIDRLNRPVSFAAEGVAVDFKEPFATQEESDKRSNELVTKNAELLTRIAAIREKLAGIAEEGSVNKEGDKTIQQLSIIADLQEKIKNLTESREAVTAGAITAANPNGGGRQRIQEYTAEIEKLQKELDRLLGKNEAKIADGRIAALKALQAAETKLRKDYEKALLDSLRDEGQARAAEQLRQDFNELAAAEAQIKALEKAYAKAGGRGVNADGQLNADTQQQLDNARVLAVEKYNEEIARINREYATRSLELRVASDEKELAQLQAKFSEEIRLAEKSNAAVGESIERAALAGNETLALSLAASKLISDQLIRDLKAAAQEQERLLIRQQTLNNIDATEQLQRTGIEAGVLPLTQSADVTADNSGAMAAEATERTGFLRGLYERLTTLEIDLEKKKQKALLQVQIEGNNARLLQYENDFSKEGIRIRAGLLDTNKLLTDQFNAIQEPEGRKFDLMKFLGVAPEDQDEARAALQQAGGLLVDQINAFAQAQVEAANQQVEARRNDLEERRAELNTEIELNKLGFASNVELRRAEVEDAKQARNQALEDQRKAVKAQQQLETVQQSVGLLTASVDILKGFNKFPQPFGLIAGIAAVTALFGFFVASKVKAANATKLEKGGYHSGNRHSQGGNKYVSVDGNSSIEIEEGEFTVNRVSTRKHRELVEAINSDSAERIQVLALRGLLQGTGVRMHSDTSKRIQRRSEAVGRESQPTLFDLAPLHQTMKGIEKNTTPRIVTYETETHKVVVDGNYRRRIRKV